MWVSDGGKGCTHDAFFARLWYHSHTQQHGIFGFSSQPETQEVLTVKLFQFVQPQTSDVNIAFRLDFVNDLFSTKYLGCADMRAVRDALGTVLRCAALLLLKLSCSYGLMCHSIFTETLKLSKVFPSLSIVLP